MVKINTDHTKCKHGIPIMEDCKKCNELIEKDKKRIVEWIRQLEKAHNSTSKSDLWFGDEKNKENM